VFTSSKRLPAIALVALLALAGLALPACGGSEERTSGEEGELVHVGDAVYQVQLTRLLNPRIRPDDAYLRGQLAPQGEEQYLGVFLQIKNEGGEDYLPPRDMKVVDTVGNEYLPLDASQSSGFGLDFGEPIAPGDEVPPPDSPAASGPVDGSLVLFKVKETSATENLPLELEIPSGGDSSSRIELDI
jgi:hypothetical protein